MAKECETHGLKNCSECRKPDWYDKPAEAQNTPRYPPLTKVLKHKLDMPELREKIAQELSRGRKRDWTIEDYRKQADQILSLFDEERK